jgi:hypothetical protein
MTTSKPQSLILMCILAPSLLAAPLRESANGEQMVSELTAQCRHIKRYRMIAASRSPARLARVAEAVGVSLQRLQTLGDRCTIATADGRGIAWYSPTTGSYIAARQDSPEAALHAAQFAPHAGRTVDSTIARVLKGDTSLFAFDRMYGYVLADGALPRPVLYQRSYSFMPLLNGVPIASELAHLNVHIDATGTVRRLEVGYPELTPEPISEPVPLDSSWSRLRRVAADISTARSRASNVSVDTVAVESIDLAFVQEKRGGALYVVPNLKCRLRCSLDNGATAVKYEMLSMDRSSKTYRKVDSWLRDR